MESISCEPPQTGPLAVVDPRRAVGRLLLSAVAGLMAAALLPAHFGWAVRAVFGWCVAATMLLALAWFVITSSGVQQTRQRCGNDDPGRFLVWVVVIIACSFSLFAAAGLMQHSRDVSRHAG